ncbi:MAG: hypothetical protein JRJ38_03445 [Deltaproteobacteria bacterium]|nr:hypothetical protein [Deltaproteobacteria bacterium]
MMEKDFSLTIYKDLIAAIKRAGFKVLTLKEYFRQKEDPTAFIILRHDVDRRPENALRMALLESSHGIRSTYYFRVKKNVFNKKIIRKIDSLGHEIGYHYEVMDKAHGDIKLAERIFDSELTEMRMLADVYTACMHGNPLYPWKNSDFLRHFPLSRFDLLGEAYISIYDPDLFYATDTGRGWNRAKYNLKDTFPDSSVRPLPSLSTTVQLIDLISTERYPKIYLQIHPNRWSWSWFQWYRQLGEDLCINSIKLLIAFYRKRK